MARVSAFALPGQQLTGAPTKLQSGDGTYTRGGQVISALAGPVRHDSKTVSVGREAQATLLPEVGQIVIGTVTRIARAQATLAIQVVGSRLTVRDIQGVIRPQDVRLLAKDTLKIWHSFRPGDLVRAQVVSPGDARSYYLSTARNDLGVISASAEDTGEPLVAISWEEMQDPTTGKTELRKVAGPAAKTD
ncbi:uncharacterized protein L969DRAFT_91393 [Mixia osmundae IAM 14324]|uniref:S1 motif domain-containing protein n=1 Tax=Mixia osmundae (strain CBS 9802 / IAM 14324 / JCM 22182 / KY 12970) TaxID=764103 RepID=G7E775_MIXOS|nr:uncharacterized protein L969DRAFT_91393 [Mixia osmundae IAM 14324]KEI41921.1 hypothetical protein L969DRAFT_91393 [Mixia osmundae IAM 14324]GAA98685.1 hypothetical protein E5Q_05373 [Mixia osmundae IAM 14324]